MTLARHGLKAAPADVRGLLVSQIGYDLGHPMRAMVRGPANTLSAQAVFRLTADGGQPVRQGPVRPWGELWGDAWWVVDFSGVEAAGRYLLEIVDGGRPVFPGEPVEIGRDLLWERTAWLVGVDQAERRARLALNRVGWQDCGAQWQEANSHAAYVFGFCDLLEFAATRLSDDHARRVALQIMNGCDYLALLQDRAGARGLGAGAVSHQTPKYEEVAMPGDAAKAAVAWARAARLLPTEWQARKIEYRRRAEAAARWARQTEPTPLRGFARAAHGAPASFVPPAAWMTRDLLTRLSAAVEMARDGAPEFEAEAVALAEQIMRCQVPAAQSEFGLYGHFRTFDACGFTEKTWIHHLDGGVVGCDSGGYFSPDLLPLVRMLERWPEHPRAGAWRLCLHDFAMGYLLPACRTNPFGIAPLGCFAGEGVIHFAGLWHGMNVVYAMTAALALELERLFGDAALGAIATDNLQWIAGLNAGLTADSLSACHMFSADVPAGVALPVSMICGIGRRWAGTWLNVRGSICNGFSTGDQFKFDVAPTLANDGPHTFTDEDWITHAGGWLSALARLAAAGATAAGGLSSARRRAEPAWVGSGRGDGRLKQRDQDAMCKPVLACS